MGQHENRGGLIWMDKKFTYEFSQAVDDTDYGNRFRLNIEMNNYAYFVELCDMVNDLIKQFEARGDELL
jgi:hypothetical protein